MAKTDHAHACTPGTGPAGETCGTCANLRVHETTRRYYKCGLLYSTHGAATDVRLRDPACLRWARA